MMERRLLVLFAETPLHAGGPGADGAVDLPIQREASTGLPVIWGQSLKGALRDAAQGQDWQIEVFGDPPPSEPAVDDGPVPPVAPTDAGGELRKGSVAIGDAQLLAFPAATLRESFAWTTCPLLLNRLERKAKLVGADPPASLRALLPSGRSLGTAGWNGTQVIGPYVDEVEVAPAVGTAGDIVGRLACPPGNIFDYTRSKMTSDLLVLPDGMFRELSRLGTDVVARVQLDENKTVKHGPFYSEHLPAEAVLVAVLANADPTHLDHITALVADQPIQLGGDETIGKGIAWCRVHDQAALTSMFAPGPPQETTSAGSAANHG